MRIVKTRYKVLYVLAWGVALLIVTDVTNRVNAAAVGDWANVLGFALMTVIAVRIFRVREEDMAAPRPSWRLTGRPLAGFWLGGLNLLSAAAGIWGLVYASATSKPSAYAATFTGGGSLPVQIVSLVIDSAFGILYLRSSLRLARTAREPLWTTRAD